MAARSKSLSGGEFVEAHPKKTRQGYGKHTHRLVMEQRNGIVDKVNSVVI